MLTPAMQGVILAIAKARQTFDSEGPEAGLIKVTHICIQRLAFTHKHHISTHKQEMYHFQHIACEHN